jgi:hypothetical protein
MARRQAAAGTRGGAGASREVFSAIGLVYIMCAGFKRIEPGMDIGVDLGRMGDGRKAGNDGIAENLLPN